MAGQEILAVDDTATQAAHFQGPTVVFPPNFQLQSVDDKLSRKPLGDPSQLGDPQAAEQTQPDTETQRRERLGVLADFQGNFAGTGYNMIFRPKGVSAHFKNQLDDNTLQLNLTQETMSFSDNLGAIPNRGLFDQEDVTLGGVFYTQSIVDVTNTLTGKADGEANPIHFEPGLWIRVPKSKFSPNSPPALARMASIPHGTTINAQCLEPTEADVKNDAPVFPDLNITPFTIGTDPPDFVVFSSQDVGTADVNRLPPDLSLFKASGAISKDILANPNQVLTNNNVGKSIKKTVEFTVSTKPTAPQLGGGISNIHWLLGTNKAKQNANAVSMKSTFWIETVEYEISVPALTAGQKARFAPNNTPQGPGVDVPFFQAGPFDVDTPAKTFVVPTTQIQYSQTVILDFAPLSWPHVSVATLVPDPVHVKQSDLI